VLFALAICKLGKQLGFFDRRLSGGFAFGTQGAERFAPDRVASSQIQAFGG
jgi:hypothetical protein